MNRIVLFVVCLALAGAVVAQSTEETRASVEFVRNLPEILMQTGILVGVIVTAFVSVIGVVRQGAAEVKRTSMDGKLDVIHTTTNSLSEAAQEAALQKGIAIGVEKERSRVAIEESALAKGRLEGAQSAHSQSARAPAGGVDPQAPAGDAADKQVAAAGSQNVAADRQLEAAAAQGMVIDKQQRVIDTVVDKTTEVVKGKKP